MIQLLYAVMTGTMLMTGAKEFDSMRECEEFAEVMRKMSTVSNAGFVCVDLSE